MANSEEVRSPALWSGMGNLRLTHLQGSSGEAWGVYMHIQTYIYDRGPTRAQNYAGYGCKSQMRQSSSWPLYKEDSRQDGGRGPETVVNPFGKEKRQQGSFKKGIPGFTLVSQLDTLHTGRECSFFVYMGCDDSIYGHSLRWPSWP